MPSKPLQIAFWVVAVFLSALVLLLNFNSASLIEQYFNEGRFDLLNKLAQSKGNLTLDYYLGEIEDTFTGPLSNTVYHVLFALFALMYLKNSRIRTYCLFVFIFLIITKFNVLFYPPYGDAIGGPFAEAIWLANNHFDYAGLAAQAGYNEGGPRVYFLSIYPAYLAILYKCIPSIKMFLVVNHLFVYLFTAISIAFTRSIAQKILNPASSILTSIVLLALPVFQSQTEAINMEMPCLMFSVVCIWYLVNKKIGWASFFAVMAALVKGHGIVVCAAVFVTSIILAFCDCQRSKRWKMLLCGFIPMFLIWLKVKLTPSAIGGLIGLFNGWPSLRIMILTKLFAYSIIIFAIFFILEKRKLSEIKKAFIENDFAVLVVFITTTMWFGLFLNFTAVSPRYKLELTPFLVMCIIFAVLRIPFEKKIGSLLIFVGIIFTALGSYGMYHPHLRANYHVLLERSLEYRNELKLNRKVIKDLNEKFQGFTIGAPFIFAQTLAMPELGYVEKPLDVVIYGMPLTYGNIKNFESIKSMNLRKTIWVALAAQFFTHKQIEYPIAKQDIIIKRYQWGDNKTTLFQGGVAIEKKRLFLKILKHRGRI